MSQTFDYEDYSATLCLFYSIWKGNFVMEEMSVLWFKTKLAMKLLKYAFADIHI